MFKRLKIKKYLSETGEKTPFYFLLNDYYSKDLESRLVALGFSSLKFEIEWGEHYRRITVCGKHSSGAYLVLTVDEKEALMSLSFEEGEDAIMLTPPQNMTDADYFYSEIAVQLKLLTIIY